MVALGTYSIYKLSKKDTERVEEYTGKPAEELSDEELSKAMDNLNIPKEELTDEEYTEFDEADVEEAEEADYIEELERLAELKQNGIITEEEFEAKKKQILGL